MCKWKSNEVWSLGVQSSFGFQKSQRSPVVLIAKTIQIQDVQAIFSMAFENFENFVVWNILVYGPWYINIYQQSIRTYR